MTARRRAPAFIVTSATLGVIAVISAAAWAYFARAILLPEPREREQLSVAREDFVGAEKCANCHSAQFALWRNSSHGRAGGPPSRETVIPRFDANAIIFRNARVTPRIRGGAYEFLVEQRGNPPQTLRVDGVIGGGHIYGGGTQGYVTNVADGTVRFLPFEWSKHASTWFCNTNARSGKGWTPITSSLRLEECGDWPPVRVLGDNPRYANCQSCHASQASLVLDTVARAYSTRFTSLAINCESCHGPGRKHVDLAGRGAFARGGDIGFTALAALDKDASSRVCYQCHAVKDQVREGFLSGDVLSQYYSTKLPLLGDRPLTPDGRIRTFAYQEGQQYSDCYLNGGMTCVSCHGPHDQQYRDVTGAKLTGRFSDVQCTSCHVSKAESPTSHTNHRAGSTSCTSCHMPSRQEPETRAVNTRYAGQAVVPYARSDHTISIPRPSVDAALGLVSACATCHAGTPIAEQEQQIHNWWGELKPINPTVAAQLRAVQLSDSGGALLLGARGGSPARDRHGYVQFAGIARYLENQVRPGADLASDDAARLRELVKDTDTDVRAAALAALHLAQGENRATRRVLAGALRAAGDSDAGLRQRWALSLGFMADRFKSSGNLPDAITAYSRALDVQPNSARLLLSRANAQREAGDLASAIESYRRSIDLDRGSPLAWVNFGIAFGEAGDTASAITALTNAASLDAGESLAWFNLANFSLVRGDLARAAELYQRTAKLDPSIALAHFQLAKVSLIRKDYPATLAHLRRGLAFDSSDVTARDLALELTRRLAGTARP